MRKLLIAAAAVGLAMPVAPALADDHAPELAKVDWYRVNMIQWHPGKRDRAHEMIEQLEKVDKALGRSVPVHMHMNSGEWDSIVAFPMRNGIAAMGWAENPDRKAWQEEFVRQIGGAENAKAFWEEFDGLIARRVSNIGHIDQD